MLIDQCIGPHKPAVHTLGCRHLVHQPEPTLQGIAHQLKGEQAEGERDPEQGKGEGLEDVEQARNLGRIDTMERWTPPQLSRYIPDQPLPSTAIHNILDNGNLNLHLMHLDLSAQSSPPPLAFVTLKHHLNHKE